MTFAERLKELRIEKGMSLGDIASYLNVKNPTIYKYEHGIITNVPPEKVHALANLFGVTRPYMMGWTDERNINADLNLDKVAYELRKEEENVAKSRWKPARAKDCITSAVQALRALNKFKISRTPIYPQQIIQESMIATMTAFGDEVQIADKNANPLALIAEYSLNGKPLYEFRISNDAPIGKLSLTLAVELGHIYLGHSGMEYTKHQNLAAQCFATHLLFPRPVIRLLQEYGYVFTERTLSLIFGYCDWCIDGILHADPVKTPAELNRLVKEQFMPYMEMLNKTGRLSPYVFEGEQIIDLSRYMAGYEE